MAGLCPKHLEFELCHICLECKNILCIQCVIEHSSKHKVVALVELATEVIQRFCREYEENTKIATEINMLRSHIKQKISDYWDGLKFRICSILDDFKLDSLKFVEGILGKKEKSISISPIAKDALMELFKKKQYYEIYKRKGTANIVSQWMGEQHKKKELLLTMYNNIPSNSVNLGFIENIFLKLEQNLYSAVDSICNANYGSFFEDNTLNLLYIPSYFKPIPLSQTVLNPAIAQAKNNIYLIGGNIGKWDLGYFNTTYVFSSAGGLSSTALLPRANLNVARAWHGAITVLDFHIYVVGGYNSQTGTLASCERYVIDRDKWVKIPSLLKRRWGLSVTSFNERMIYTFFGVNDKALSTAIEVFDTCGEEMGWTIVYDPDKLSPHLRRCHASFQNSNTEMLIFGGDSGQQLQSKCLLYSTKNCGITYTSNDFACRPHPSYYRCANRTHSNVVYKLACGSQAAAYNGIYKAWIVFELCALKVSK